MIARIATEDQYRLPDERAERLASLDDDVAAAAERGDEEGFNELFAAMLALVRGGEPVGADELVESDVILPPPDTSFAAARVRFRGEGLLPG